MFRNIGDKIKIVAEVSCWLGIVGSVLYGIIIAGRIEDSILLSLLIGVLIMGLGSLLSWIGSFVLYGFGQLIENSDILVEKADRIEKSVIQMRNSCRRNPKGEAGKQVASDVQKSRTGSSFVGCSE